VYTQGYRAIIRTAILDRIGNSVSRFVLSRTVPRDTVRHIEHDRSQQLIINKTVTNVLLTSFCD